MIDPNRQEHVATAEIVLQDSENQQSFEISRRDALRRMLGLSVGAAAICCGIGALHSHFGQNNSLGDAEAPTLSTLDQIQDGASAKRTAERGTAFQAGPTLPPPTPSILWKPGDLIFAGDRNGPKIVSFTFDDGPWHTYTQGVMNHFKQKGLEGNATFFWVANNAKFYSAIAREVVNRGYGIANHSLTHSTYVASKIAAEIAPAQELIFATVGIRPEYFRSPGLTEGASIQNELARLGMCNIFTSTNLNDSTVPRIGPWEINNNLARTIHPGNIILVHDGGTHRETMDATPLMIDTARAKGYQIVPLPELLATGILQKRVQSLQRTEQQIREQLQTDEAVMSLTQDRFDWLVELKTALTEATNLSPEQKMLIEKEIKSLEKK